MDVCDVAEQTTEFFLREALTHRKEVSVPTICTFCEEAPVAILPNGCRSRYCAECLPIAVAA
jgi:hypothetical protein